MMAAKDTSRENMQETMGGEEGEVIHSFWQKEFEYLHIFLFMQVFFFSLFGGMWSEQNDYLYLFKSESDTQQMLIHSKC